MNMGGIKNVPIEVSLSEACFEWKIFKIVDLIGRIRFEVCGYKNYKKECHVKFLC